MIGVSCFTNELRLPKRFIQPVVVAVQVSRVSPDCGSSRTLSESDVVFSSYKATRRGLAQDISLPVQPNQHTCLFLLLRRLSIIPFGIELFNRQFFQCPIFAKQQPHPLFPLPGLQNLMVDPAVCWLSVAPTIGESDRSVSIPPLLQGLERFQHKRACHSPPQRTPRAPWAARVVVSDKMDPLALDATLLENTLPVDCPESVFRSFLVPGQ